MSDLLNEAGVVVHLDKKRKLRYNLPAMYRLQEKYGSYFTAAEILTSILNDVLLLQATEHKLSEFMEILLIGLMHEDENVKECENEIMNGIDALNFYALAKAMMEAIDSTLPLMKTIENNIKDEVLESENEERKN